MEPLQFLSVLTVLNIFPYLLSLLNLFYLLSCFPHWRSPHYRYGRGWGQYDLFFFCLTIHSVVHYLHLMVDRLLMNCFENCINQLSAKSFCMTFYENFINNFIPPCCLQDSDIIFLFITADCFCNFHSFFHKIEKMIIVDVYLLSQFAKNIK